MVKVRGFRIRPDAIAILMAVQIIFRGLNNANKPNFK